MENISSVTSFEDDMNVPQTCVLNNEERNILDEDTTHEEQQRKLVLNPSNANYMECETNFDETNIPTKEICRDIIIENESDVDETLTTENECDSGVCDIKDDNQAESSNKGDVSGEEESVNKDENFPILNDDSYVNSEDELPFHKGIFEAAVSNDELPLSSAPGVSCTSSRSHSPNPVDDDVDDDAAPDVEESENECRATRKELTLPYFQLPKPDLDEFLIETEKNLQIHIPVDENKFSEHGRVSVVHELKQKKSTTVSLKPPVDAQRNFFDPRKAFITFDLSSDCTQDSYSKKESSVSKTSHEVSSILARNDYKKVLSSICDVDESKSPGIKRLALKEFLKEQIDQKKCEAFNQSKLLNMEDEEMEDVPAERDEECPDTEDDSLEEDEEPTVSFEHDVHKLDDAESDDEIAVVNETEETLTDDESDEDFIGVRKMKKKIIVIDEESCDDTNFSKEVEQDSLENKNSSLCEFKMPEVTENECNKKSDDKLNLNMCDTKALSRDAELSKNRANSFGEGNSALSQISCSIPSYQPGGGFLNEELRQESSSDSITSIQSQHESINEDLYTHYQPEPQEEKFLRSSRTEVLENASDDSNTFGMKLDNLPVTQTENDSDIFSSKELADVCSGAFNKSAVPEEMPGVKYLCGQKLTDFFDDEAELSGEDDGVDDKDDSEFGEDDNLDLFASDEEDLPTAEVLREEIADLHMKRIMDEDEERIKEIQEQLFDDGELNSDGAGRSRRFAWINNDADMPAVENNSDSDSDADLIDDSSISINQDKAKWQQENKEDEKEDLTEELNSSGYRRKSFLKVNIIGKPKFSPAEDSSRLSYKRSRGSFLNLDNGSACQVLKKLKASEDNLGGSRTTKHFVFRNDLHGDSVVSKAVPSKEAPIKAISVESPCINRSLAMRSIFNKI